MKLIALGSERVKKKIEYVFLRVCRSCLDFRGLYY